MRARGVGTGVRDDEHAGFDRPRRTRPRTKDRPDYSDAPVGMVVTIDRGRYRVIVEEEAPAAGTKGARPAAKKKAARDTELRHVTAAKARQLGRMGVIVGDRVRLDGDVTGEEGTLARIVEVLERRTVLRRTADDDDPYERAIVANADQLVIVTALADPPPRVGMIDRIMVAAFDAGIEPMLLLTKADLASPDALSAAYTPLGVPVLATQPGSDLDELRAWLAGHRTVFVGHSGVGKSTLVNALIPGAGRTTGVVNDVTGRGRQTSTSAVVLELPLSDDLPTGWVIDTPGVRSFGLSHVTRESILSAFADLEAFTADCPRGCTHETGAPECALDLAVERGELAPARLESFRRMLGTNQ
ncbi:ribosome biogenesis GTPase [Microlunatus sagamiharensis]|uniref:Small ribosomal subunit biogenesis GTPase RsgA n=1 Tax=Microlunatus sagamiharensis TaxID=546874 RepID=A0A1H2MAA5_9ACTN|nr:ribosome small subunit-dependent GTPase A [Microlunatus sagamiharensis]SDU90180.1 ribosome biogenesis GTPase [Microlunatus sagamiharensis]